VERSSNIRAASAVALLGSGLLAGALFYGLANVDPTFAAVPLDVHLTFRVQLMTRNGVVMQALMAVSFAGAVWLAAATRGRVRACAVGAAALTAATFLVTRFGNVPINDEIRAWAAGALAPDFQERLQVWGVFNDIRVTTAVAAFALLVAAAAVVRSPGKVGAAR
jgi:uncharacterized membrane protein